MSESNKVHMEWEVLSRVSTLVVDISPSSVYSAKALVCMTGLEAVSIHVRRVMTM